MRAAYELSESELRSASLAVLAPIPHEKIETAWISGSLVEGLGNPSSDIDIFVALRGSLDGVPVTRRDTDHAVLGLVEDGLRYDLEFWTDADVARLSAKVAAIPVDDPQRNNLHFLDYWETEFVHRLFVGIPVVKENNFVALRGRFDKARFGRLLLDTAIRRSDDAFDDAVGMLRAGQARLSALRARDAMQFAVDAFLYARGVTNDKTKFRLRKLEILSGTLPEAAVVLDRLWLFESRIPDDEATLALYVESVLRFSSELIEDAQMLVRRSTGREEPLA